MIGWLPAFPPNPVRLPASSTLTLPLTPECSSPNPMPRDDTRAGPRRASVAPPSPNHDHGRGHLHLHPSLSPPARDIALGAFVLQDIVSVLTVEMLLDFFPLGYLKPSLTQDPETPSRTRRILARIFSPPANLNPTP